MEKYPSLPKSGGNILAVDLELYGQIIKTYLISIQLFHTECLNTQQESNTFFGNRRVASYFPYYFCFVSDTVLYVSNVVNSIYLLIESQSLQFLKVFLCDMKLILCELLIYIFFLFRATSVAYGGSQAKGQIKAVAARLCHSHSNNRSKPCLRPTPQLTAKLDPSCYHFELLAINSNAYRSQKSNYDLLEYIFRASSQCAVSLLQAHPSLS